jgi:hypothetical protein
MSGGMNDSDFLDQQEASISTHKMPHLKSWCFCDSSIRNNWKINARENILVHSECHKEIYRKNVSHLVCTNVDASSDTRGYAIYYGNSSKCKI